MVVLIFKQGPRRRERLSNYQEAAKEMEHRHNASDDPEVKAANPPRIWHAAKVRAEAQMHVGAQDWSPAEPWTGED